MKVHNDLNFKANLIFMLKNWLKWDKKGILVCFLRIPALIALPAIKALIPKIMVDYVEASVDVLLFVKTIAIFSFILALLSWIDPFLMEISNSVGQNIRMRYRILAFEKLLHMDYANLESYEGRIKFERGKDFAFGGRRSGSENLLYTMLDFVTAIFGVLAYITLLSRLNHILLIVLVTTCSIEFFVSQAINRLERSYRDNEVKGWYKLGYFFQIATSAQSGKDVRIYNAKDWFIKQMAVIVANHQKALKILTKQIVHLSASQALLAFIRDFCAYVFLASNVLSRALSVSDFIFYTGIVTGFSAWISSISNQILTLQKINESCSMFRAFLEIPDHQTINELSPPTLVENIQFNDVFFSYDGSEDILKNVSFTVRKGEKIAIVGRNGAGKTTLIKLLCGLYTPRSGSIKINDIDIEMFNKEEYYNLLSVVFQDYNFLPTSILTNICLGDSTQEDGEKIDNVLRQAGLIDKIKSLSNGVRSKMIKQVNEDAVEFSGGEKQRILLARALYKNAPVLILDEPTAALDPIAEKNLYEKYDSLTMNKTVFFISHRLASTRFCDRILYMKDGQIAEVGTHDELLKRKGDYWQMFQRQSLYYQDKETVLNG